MTKAGTVEATAAVTVQAPAELAQETNSMLVWAQGLKVTTSAEHNAAMERLKVVKTVAKRITDFFRPMKQAADESKRKILDAEKQLAEPLATAEKLAKEVLLKYQLAEEEKRVAEERRLQAEAEEKARKERERLEKEAAKLKTPELKEERLAQAAAVVAPVVTVESRVQTSGSSLRSTWKANLVDMNALIQAAAGGNDLAKSFLMFNDKVADSFARNTKGAMACPGIEWKEEKGLAVSTR